MIKADYYLETHLYNLFPHQTIVLFRKKQTFPNLFVLLCLNSKNRKSSLHNSCDKYTLQLPAKQELAVHMKTINENE